MIPLFRPSCTDAEVEAVTAALRSGWWGLGPRVAELEAEFAAFAGARHAIAVSSATAALELSLDVLDAGPGDEVIVPALTFASTGLVPLRAGCRVVLADVEERTLCLDWADVVRKASDATRAVIPVWYGGTVAPPPRWPHGALLHPAIGWADVIEDCAHAAGSAGAGRQGLLACWSFHAVKNIAAGDGGMITTDDGTLAARLRRLRWLGIDRSTWEREQRPAGYGWDYDIPEPGRKAHMNDLTAALALAQLRRLDELNESRRLRVRQYLEELKGLGWLRLPEYREGSSWHLFVVRVPAEARDRLIACLLASGVSAGMHYKPLNNYAAFGPRQDLPVTDRVWRELVTLPLFPDMTSSEQDQVVAAVKAFRPR